MAKLYFLSSLSVCFLILFHAQALRLGQQSPAAGRIQCQVQNINPLQPSRTIQSEGGVTQHWDENNEQLDCAGVSLTRHVIQPRGLLLPHFHNAPMLSYIIQGRGIHGAAMPGCPQTYQSAVQQQQQEQQSQPRVDQHQKVRSVSQGDIIATPVGVANWIYNDGQTPLIIVTLLDTSNNENQLDDKRRTFYLGGNPQRRPRTRQGQEHSSNNIFSGFDDQMLAEAFGVSPQTARKLMGENDNRGNIILLQNELQLIMPPMSSRMGQQNEEENRLNIQSIVGTPAQESLCNTKLRTNIDDPSRADVYNPRAGRINRLNSQKLPVLSYLHLNAERGVLYSGALMAPHWNLNAHSVIYVTRGSARVQIVGNYRQPIYDGELRQEQVLVVPQNFAVVKKAGDKGFEWISFKTNDNAVTHPIAGRNSAIRAMPREILMNAFRISSQEADRLKYNRNEFEIFAPQSKCQGNGCVA